ncbi:MAG: hypothetical protein Q3988_01475 [Gemella sp.]|nr:hypothetical protein [Gemella sp.]
MKKILVLVGTIGMLAVPVAVAQEGDVSKVMENNSIVQTLKSNFVKEEVVKTAEVTENKKVDTEAKQVTLNTSEEVNAEPTNKVEEVKVKDAQTNKVVEVKAKDLVGIVASTAKVETEEEKVELKTKLDAVVTQNTVKDEATKEVVVELGPNDLFGLVGGPESEYNTPEFQAKWDAMMAQRTVDQAPAEETTTVEEN